MCSGYMKGPPRVTECQSRIGGTGRLLEVSSYFERSACNSCQVVPLLGANSDKDKISHTLANKMAKRPGEPAYCLPPDIRPIAVGETWQGGKDKAAEFFQLQLGADTER